jgi:hypothetical protein
MTRKLWILGIVAVLGMSVAIAGFSHTRNAAACDDATKSASATPSCCAKDGAKTASVDAHKVHNSMIKSAVVTPGVAPILNIAAFGGMLASEKNSDCDWCPGTMSASGCAAHMTASECAAKMGTAADASSSGCPFMMQQSAGMTATHEGCNGATATVASVEGAAHPGCSDATTAATHAGCTRNMATVASAGHECTGTASAAAHSGCDKSMAAAAGCCEGKTASAEHGDECTGVKTASLKGLVDEMPYRENKRVVLTGSYACGHCTLQKTEECTPMLKTADGKIYPLLRNSHASELRMAEGKNVEVSGSVKKVDGVKFLEVKSYKVL